MSVVGATELVFFEIAIVAFVGIAIPQLARQWMTQKYKYGELTKSISWAPPAYLFGVVWSIMYFALLPVAVYRVRILGNWQTGVNLTALVFFWILQFALVTYNFLYIVNLWLGFLSVAVSLGLSVATTYFFFALDTAAGILVLPLDVWLLYASALALAVAVKNKSKGASSSTTNRRLRARQQVY